MSDPTPYFPAAERTGDWIAAPRGGLGHDADTNVKPGGARPVLLSSTEQGEGGDWPHTVGVEGLGYPRDFGNYQLLSEIARGGMGVVYRAKQKGLGRIVALKTILPSMVASTQAVARFYQEAQAAAALDHPGIVAIHEIGECQGEHYFTMSFVEGTSLTARVRGGSPFAAEEAARIVRDVAIAVGYAHERGILHRDLKPDNILLEPAGRARVTDFGLAKQLDKYEQGLTVTGQIMGTPSYMSPEQALGGKRTIGPPSDVYALGGILYFLLTGHAPFRGDSITEVLCKVAQERPVSPRTFAVGVPAKLEEVCLRCLEKKPEDRYGSAAELAKALDEYLDNPTLSPARASVVLSPSPATQPLPRRKSKMPLLITVAALAALVGVGATVAFTVISASPSAVVEAPPDPPTQHKLAEEPPRHVGIAPAAAETRRDDFGLRVEMIGAPAPKDNVYHFTDGDKIRFRVQVERDAYVGVWTVDPKGTITLLFPHAKEPDNFIPAGVPRVVPGGSTVVELTIGEGAEQVVVLASSEPLKLPKGEDVGDFQLFRKEADRERWRSVVRGMKLKTASARQVSERVLRYDVAAK